MGLYEDVKQNTQTAYNTEAGMSTISAKGVDTERKLWYTLLAGRDTLYTCVSELTFKRTVSTSGTGGAAERRLFTYPGWFCGHLHLF